MVGPPPASWDVAPGDAGARLCAPGLWRLRLPLPWVGNTHVNAYAVRMGDGIMLVDCGSAGHETLADALVAALSDAGFAAEDVRVLVLTHAHTDHAGLAAWLVDRTGCDVWMHPGGEHALDILRAPDAIEAARRRLAEREGVPAERLAAFAGTAEELEGFSGLIADARPLHTGTTLASSDVRWDVLETPGHAPSHVCLHDRARSILIAGDLLCTAFVPWMDYGYTEDPLAELLASLDRVEALPGLVLALPGHGRPIEDVPAAVAMQREGLRRRLAMLGDALTLGPAGAYELTERMFGELQPDVVAVERMTEVLCYLAHLRVTGAVRREWRLDGTRRHALARDVDRQPTDS